VSQERCRRATRTDPTAYGVAVVVNVEVTVGAIYVQLVTVRVWAKLVEVVVTVIVVVETGGFGQTVTVVVVSVNVGSVKVQEVVGVA